MDLKEIRSIVDIMKRSDLTEFEIEEEGLKLRIRRGSADGPTQIITGQTPSPFPSTAAEPANSTQPPPGKAQEEKNAVENEGVTIDSPMVGTFYRAPSPESAPFVTVGDSVKEDTVVCIIEAMKVMNEIQAEVAGQILEVFVENGATVEYGQPLFRVKKG